MGSTEKAARVGVQTPTPEGPARLASLTSREREALELVQLGLSNAEVARHLFISDGTVRKHLENAFQKLDVHSRTQAVAVMSAARVLPRMPYDPDGPKELPRYLTSFVGRRRELQQIDELLKKTRLLTMTGSGGVGKTRLALQVAGDLSGVVDADTAFVELGGLADSSLVPQAVASALGPSGAGGVWRGGHLDPLPAPEAFPAGL